jgi:hypothetical protein
LTDDAQRIDRKEQRRKQCHQRHAQDQDRADQGAAIAGEPTDEFKTVHQRISIRGSSHM